MSIRASTRIPGAAHGGSVASVTTGRSLLYVAPPSGFVPLRVVLLVPREVPAWLMSFAELAASSAWVDLTILPAADAQVPSVDGVAADIRGYLAFERVRHRNRNACGLLAPVAVGSRDGLKYAPEIAVGTQSRELRKAVMALRPDLILLLGPSSWSEALADCATSGCWLLDAGLVDANRGGLALLAPIVAGDSATGTELELAYPDGRCATLDNSWGSTLADSFELQRDMAFRKLPALLMRGLRKLATGESLLRSQQAARLRFATPMPGAGAGLRAFFIASSRFARRRLRKEQPAEPWRLVLRRGVSPIDPDTPEVGPASALYAPQGVFWADPCVVEDDGRQLIFAEEFPENMGKGSIVCIALDNDGNAERLGVALEEAWHLSYPQAFRWQGSWHMTVESGAARCVRLYRADKFPLCWTRVSDLIVDRVCVDPTLHEHEGHWYLFANVSESDGSTCDELFVFVADSPLGPFRPHPANPIVSDVRRARPAGRLFHHGGRLIRPAQNCAPSYGAQVVFNEILELSPLRYSERPLGRLKPWMPRLDGCHTYSAVEGLEVLDVRDRSGRSSQ